MDTDKYTHSHTNTRTSASHVRSDSDRTQPSCLTNDLTFSLDILRARIQDLKVWNQVSKIRLIRGENSVGVGDKGVGIDRKWRRAKWRGKKEENRKWESLFLFECVQTYTQSLVMHSYFYVIRFIYTHTLPPSSSNLLVRVC
jgi:hypothetical protein